MIDLKTILKAWGNVIIEDAEIEAIAEYRLAICDQCEHKVKQLGLDVCNGCGCPLIAKTRSNDSCPVGKW